MTPEAYARQFALARRIEAAARVAEAVTALDTVHAPGGGGRPTRSARQALLGPDFEARPAPLPGSRRCARSPAS